VIPAPPLSRPSSVDYPNRHSNDELLLFRAGPTQGQGQGQGHGSATSPTAPRRQQQERRHLLPERPAKSRQADDRPPSAPRVALETERQRTPIEPRKTTPPKWEGEQHARRSPIPGRVWLLIGCWLFAASPVAAWLISQRAYNNDGDAAEAIEAQDPTHVPSATILPARYGIARSADKSGSRQANRSVGDPPNPSIPPLQGGETNMDPKAPMPLPKPSTADPQAAEPQATVLPRPTTSTSAQRRSSNGWSTQTTVTPAPMAPSTITHYGTALADAGPETTLDFHPATTVFNQLIPAKPLPSDTTTETVGGTESEAGG